MTSGQREVLNALTDGPLTVRELADLGHGNSGTRSRLRRLEDHGLVRRTYGDVDAARWELTHAGRSALQLTT